MSTRLQGDQHEALLYRLLVRDLKEYAIFQIGLDHKTSSWNAGVEENLGYGEMEFLGLPFSRLFTDEDIAAGIPEQELEEARETGRSEDERWHVRKDGSVFFVHGAVTALYGDGVITGYSKVMRDRTEQHQAQESLKVLNEELANFSAVVSHDLRTPLRTVRAFAQLLAKESGECLSSSSKEYLAHILAGTESMGHLIEALLAYARAGEVELPLQKVDLAIVASTVWENLRSLVQETDACLSFEGEPCVLRVNSILLTQVLQNLMENALKYRGGARPGITLQGRMRSRDWLISVRDNGRGFDQNHANQIFEPLKRLAMSNEQGSGIGLAICKKIIHRMGGQIWAKSQVGKESTFFFTIPR